MRCNVVSKQITNSWSSLYHLSLAFWSLDKLHLLKRVVVRMSHTVALIRVYLATKSQIIDQQAPTLSEKSRALLNCPWIWTFIYQLFAPVKPQKYGIQDPTFSFSKSVSLNLGWNLSVVLLVMVIISCWLLSLSLLSVHIKQRLSKLMMFQLFHLVPNLDCSQSLF